MDTYKRKETALGKKRANYKAFFKQMASAPVPKLPKGDSKVLPAACSVLIRGHECSQLELSQWTSSPPRSERGATSRPSAAGET